MFPTLSNKPHLLFSRTSNIFSSVLISSYIFGVNSLFNLSIIPSLPLFLTIKLLSTTSILS